MESTFSDIVSLLANLDLEKVRLTADLREDLDRFIDSIGDDGFIDRSSIQLYKNTEMEIIATNRREFLVVRDAYRDNHFAAFTVLLEDLSNIRVLDREPNV